MLARHKAGRKSYTPMLPSGSSGLARVLWEALENKLGVCVLPNAVSVSSLEAWWSPVAAQAAMRGCLPTMPSSEHQNSSGPSSRPEVVGCLSGLRGMHTSSCASSSGQQRDRAYARHPATTAKELARALSLSEVEKVRTVNEPLCPPLCAECSGLLLYHRFAKRSWKP